jgi:hypothetical protein
MKEFFGIGGYTREPEGFLSWQHLLFVSTLMALMTVFALIFGIRNRNKEHSKKNNVIVVSAILIDVIELFKVIMISIATADPMRWRYELPLFLCSIMLVALPLAAFSKGRIK